MSFKKTLLTAGLLAATASSNATVINGASLQGIIDGLTVGGTSSIDVNTDQATPDEKWNTVNTGVSTSRFIAELAGNHATNTFGIYDVYNVNNYVELFAGTDSAGDKKGFEILADGSVEVNFTDTLVDFTSQAFGFYLGNSRPVFYSEEDKNAGDEDQMVAYQGGNGDFLNLPNQAPNKLWTDSAFFIAFEDIQYSSSDKDFNDLVVFVDNIRTVSEPGTFALLGLGLAGLGFARRKQAKA